MNDERGLNALAAECHEMARRKGFWNTIGGNNVGEKLMMIVGELAEAHEEYRAGHPIGIIEYEHLGLEPHTYRRTRSHMEKAGLEFPPRPGKPVGFAIELADALIRTLDLADGLGIDIEEAVRVKMDYNATRPHLHGKLV